MAVKEKAPEIDQFRAMVSPLKPLNQTTPSKPICAAAVRRGLRMPGSAPEPI
jgi:hypothetical protein